MGEEMEQEVEEEELVEFEMCKWEKYKYGNKYKYKFVFIQIQICTGWLQMGKTLIRDIAAAKVDGEDALRCQQWM